MRNKIIEGDGRRGGQPFLANLVRIVVFVVLWNLFLNAEILQHTSTIVKIFGVIVFVIVLEISVRLIYRIFRDKNKYNN